MSTYYSPEKHLNQARGTIVAAASLCAMAVTGMVVVVALAIGGHFGTHTAAAAVPTPAHTAGTITPATPVTPITPATPVYPAPTASVMTLQRQLAQLNYYEGNIDGIMGPQTIHAIDYLQRDAGLPQTGQMNAATQTALANFLAHGNNQMAS